MRLTGHAERGREVAGAAGERGARDSPEGRVLYDGDVEGKRSAVSAAFIEHGYPWENVEPTGAPQ